MVVGGDPWMSLVFVTGLAGGRYRRSSGEVEEDYRVVDGGPDVCEGSPCSPLNGSPGFWWSSRVVHRCAGDPPELTWLSGPSSVDHAIMTFMFLPSACRPLDDVQTGRAVVGRNQPFLGAQDGSRSAKQLGRRPTNDAMRKGPGRGSRFVL